MNKTSFAVFAVAFLGFVGVAQAKDPEVLLKSVVLIKSKESLGSGFFVSNDGKIVTNFHVIEGSSEVTVELNDGRLFMVRHATAVDAENDLVILQVPLANAPALALKETSLVKIGESVMALGSPSGLAGSVTNGIVSAIRDGVIQTDTAINPGNSGGPLVDKRGRVVGVVTAKLKGTEGLNFAVGSTRVAKLLKERGQKIALASLQPSKKLEQPKEVVVQPSYIGRRVKNPKTGTVHQITIAGETLYVEAIMHPNDQQLGLRAVRELRKSGTHFIGRPELIVPNQFNAEAGRPEMCTVVLPEERWKLLPDRIEVEKDSYKGTGPCTYDLDGGTDYLTLIPTNDSYSSDSGSLERTNSFKNNRIESMRREEQACANAIRLANQECRLNQYSYGCMEASFQARQCTR